MTSLAQTRQAARLTQTEAAQLIGVNLRTWQRYERDERCMRPVLREAFERKLLLLERGLRD